MDFHAASDPLFELSCGCHALHLFESGRVGWHLQRGDDASGAVPGGGVRAGTEQYQAGAKTQVELAENTS